MPTTDHTMTLSYPEQTGALLRHFADLRDGTHGSATSRREKEQLFAEASHYSIRTPAKHSKRSTRTCCSTPARSPPPGFDGLPPPASIPPGHSHGQGSEPPASSRY
jgi:hypothetical protein